RANGRAAGPPRPALASRGRAAVPATACRDAGGFPRPDRPGGGGLVRGPPVVAGVRRPDPPRPRARGARRQLRPPERRRAHRGGTGAGRRRRLGPLSARRIPGVGGAPEDLFHPDLSQHDIQYLPGVLNVAWEIDVWGRIRRATEAARAQFLATEEARRGVVVTLVSDVGTNYFTLLELDRELAIALDSAETYRRTLDVFTRRYVGGTDTKISTSRAAANLQSSIANVAILERQITQQEDAISVLLGANPEPVDRGMPLVDQATPVTPPRLTTDLLRRRPDIRQAEQNMINANAEIGVAVAS